MPVFSRTSWINWRCAFPFSPASTLIPSTSIVPNEGSSRKLMQRSRVLFPEPLRPMMQTTSRGETSAEMPLRTCSRPKYLSRFETLTIGIILTIPPGKARLDDALNIGQDDGHDPVEDRRDDQRFQVVELSAAHAGRAPHHF